MLTTRLDVGSSSARQCVRVMSPIHIVTAIVLAAVASIVAHPAQAQTWATPGVSSDIGAGGNWVGGTPPAFVGTANVIFSASTNTAVKLRNVTPTLTTDGDYFSTVT